MFKLVRSDTDAAHVLENTLSECCLGLLSIRLSHALSPYECGDLNIVHGATVRLAVFRDGARAALTAPCWSCVSQENIVFLPGKGTPFWTRGDGLRALLGSGQRVVLHCYAGLGRTGTIGRRLSDDSVSAPKDLGHLRSWST